MKKGFTVHWNGPPARCVGQPHSRCESFFRAVKAFHMSPRPGIPNGWSDIAYSFGMCPHGIPMVGRGWNKNQFANGKDVVGVNNGPDSQWFSIIVFLGEGERPTPAMVSGVQALIREGRQSGRCAAEVKPHKDWKVKSCPGDEFTFLCRQWDGRPVDGGGVVIPPAPTGPRVLRMGHNGADVKDLQVKLTKLGFPLVADGQFGAATDKAVRAFQKQFGMGVDGAVGPITWAAINLRVWSSAPAPTPPPAPKPTPYPTLRVGASGQMVKVAQLRLAWHGLKLAVDGKFGPSTKANVVTFQKAKRLTADGVVGPATWVELWKD